MDRRTLIAFVLAGLVLVVWGILFPAPPGPDSRGGSGDTTGVSEAPDRTGDVAPSISESSTGTGIPPASGETGQPLAAGVLRELDWEPVPLDTLVVETDWLEARIPTRGGGLTQLKLKEFPSGQQPGPVDLVRSGQEALDLGLVWGERQLSLHSARFTARRESRIEGETRVEHVVLTARRSDGVIITREYTFRDQSYEVGHVVQVEGLPAGADPPELVVGWRSGIPFTEENRQADEQFFAAIVRVGDDVNSWGPGKFKQGPKRVEGAVRWVAVSNKYFLAALVPAQGTATAATADGDRTSLRNSAWLTFPAASASGGRADLTLYLGPRDLDRVKALDVGLGDAVSLGYRWMRPLTQMTLKVLKGTYAIIPNYGLVIIVLSILVRILVFPLSQASMKSMKAMQALAPEIEALRKKYADKPQELNKLVMQLYQKNKVNPLGGCLPLVLQMPVLFALYFVLMFAIDLRMAPFGLWIDDLSAPDTITRISGFPIHVLPLIMTAVSVLQARSAPKDPRQAMMTTLMPIMFLVFFYGMPSGLVLYWTVTNLGAWAQQAWVNRTGNLPQAAGGSEGSAATPPVGRAVVPAPDGDGDGAGKRGAGQQGKPQAEVPASRRRRRA
jgi:YidC/Oxa1 family membrane protein insertase